MVIVDRATRATNAATPSATGPNGVIVIVVAPVPTTSPALNVGVDAGLATQARRADDAVAGPRVHAAHGTSVTLATPRAATVRASDSPPGQNASIGVLAPEAGGGGTAGPIGRPSVPTNRPAEERATTVRTVDDRIVPVPNARIGRPDRTVPQRAASGGTIAVASPDASTMTGPDGVGTSVTATDRSGRTGPCPAISAEASGSAEVPGAPTTTGRTRTTRIRWPPMDEGRIGPGLVRGIVETGTVARSFGATTHEIRPEDRPGRTVEQAPADVASTPTALAVDDRGARAETIPAYREHGTGAARTVRARTTTATPGATVSAGTGGIGRTGRVVSAPTAPAVSAPTAPAVTGPAADGAARSRSRNRSGRRSPSGRIAGTSARRCWPTYVA